MAIKRVVGRGPTQHGRAPLERAQLVWQRARQPVDAAQPHDRLVVALDLLRTAYHDPTQMAHALTLGRTHLRRHPDDVEARRGVGILEHATAFLGVKPIAGDVGAARRGR